VLTKKPIFILGDRSNPEGIISATAMRCLDGYFQGQLVYNSTVVKTGLISESNEKNLV
jgi:fructose-1,6-bisphosphatase/sedoheptulose 1,7-bisphosphatase-like protein